MPSREALEFASDKYRTLKLPNRLGLASQKLSSLTQAIGSQHQDAFPVVVKDRFSVRWTEGKAVFGSVACLTRAAELENKVAERVRAAGDVLIQEFTGGGSVFLVSWPGEKRSCLFNGNESGKWIHGDRPAAQGNHFRSILPRCAQRSLDFRNGFRRGRDGGIQETRVDD